eukprot:6184657-Pleurochrysis_carterae.AAC.1
MERMVARHPGGPRMAAPLFCAAARSRTGCETPAAYAHALATGRACGGRGVLGRHRSDLDTRRPRNLSSSWPHVPDVKHASLWNSEGLCRRFSSECACRSRFQNYYTLPVVKLKLRGQVRAMLRGKMRFAKGSDKEKEARYWNCVRRWYVCACVRERTRVRGGTSGSICC